MRGDEDLRVRVGVKRVNVDYDRSDDERRCGERPPARVEPAPVGEIRGEERQHDEADVAREPVRLLLGEAGGEPGDLDRDGRRDGERERLENASRCERRRVVVTQELLPQTTAVLARELTRELVQVAHPLHADQERLVVGETGRVQVSDLLAKVILELVDIVAVRARRPRHVSAPLRNLRLDALHCHGFAAAV